MKTLWSAHLAHACQSMPTANQIWWAWLSGACSHSPKWKYCSRKGELRGPGRGALMWYPSPHTLCHSSWSSKTFTWTSSGVQIPVPYFSHQNTPLSNCLPFPLLSSCPFSLPYPSPSPFPLPHSFPPPLPLPLPSPPLPSQTAGSVSDVWSVSGCCCH